MDQETLKARIRALKQMTVAQGCTESEAMAAAAKAAELMRKAGISEAELDVDKAHFSPRSIRSVLSRLWATIAACTNCVAVVNNSDGSITFIGVSPGPEVAAYLCDVCRRAIAAAEQDYKATPDYKRLRKVLTRRRALQDFRAGMSGRLGLRLQELFRSSIDASAKDRALAAAEAEFGATSEVKLPTTSAKATGAKVAGWSAGNSVALNHGVASAQADKMIGHH